MQVFVKKLDGRLEPFDESKLRNSLKKAGADGRTIEKIMLKVRKMLFNRIETRVLFDFVLNEFRKQNPETSSKYNLKNAIMNLGKEGYVFEKFVAKIFEKKGFKTELNDEIEGQFVSHEIDVIASKEKERIMVECKFHRYPWFGCSIQTALYVYARFLDVQGTFSSAMLVTNTKFSSQVIKYSNGVGLGLMGWNYPAGNGLEFNIEKFRLYPINMLPFLSVSNAKKCIKKNILTIEDFVKTPLNELSKILLVPEKKVIGIVEKALDVLK